MDADTEAVNPGGITDLLQGAAYWSAESASLEVEPEGDGGVRPSPAQESAASAHAKPPTGTGEVFSVGSPLQARPNHTDCRGLAPERSTEATYPHIPPVPDGKPAPS